MYLLEGFFPSTSVRTQNVFTLRAVGTAAVRIRLTALIKLLHFILLLFV